MSSREVHNNVSGVTFNDSRYSENGDYIPEKPTESVSRRTDGLMIPINKKLTFQSPAGSRVDVNALRL
jgi:hypothetical protein